MFHNVISVSFQTIYIGAKFSTFQYVISHRLGHSGPFKAAITSVSQTPRLGSQKSDQIVGDKLLSFETINFFPGSFVMNIYGLLNTI